MKINKLFLASLPIIISLCSCDNNEQVNNENSNSSLSISDESVEHVSSVEPSEISSDVSSLIPTEVPSEPTPIEPTEVPSSELIEEPSEPTDEPSILPNEPLDSLKVLFLGNSFALDTMEYVPNIAKSYEIENIKFATLYIGGCSIDRHFENAYNNNALYEYYVNEGNGWSSTYNKSILSALKEETWDYIAIQHGTGDKSRYADINSYLNLPNLIEYIYENINYDPKIVFNMTWVGEKGSHEELINVFNNDTNAYYKAICELTEQKIAKLEELDIICPTGTAIQNARTADVGLLTRDNYHLSLQTGRYIAALTFFSKITGIDITNVSWAPNNMNQYMIDVSIESSNNALITPYSVTNSILEAPEFQWPDVTYGEAATPSNPYFAHPCKDAPTVNEKIDLLPYFNLSNNFPVVNSTIQTGNNLGLTIDLNKTPYLYYSFIIPEGSDFTFSIYSDTTYSPWLTFLDVTKGNAKLNSGAENWDALFSSGRKQYSKVSQTGCIDLREYSNPNATKWIISMMKLYTPKKDAVTMCYFFVGSEN